MNVGRNRVFRTVDDDELDILLRGTRRAGRQGANGIMGGQLQSAGDILALSDETGGKVHTGGVGREPVCAFEVAPFGGDRVQADV
jgi:hypothetical protein